MALWAILLNIFLIGQQLSKAVWHHCFGSQATEVRLYYRDITAN